MGRPPIRIRGVRLNQLWNTLVTRSALGLLIAGCAVGPNYRVPEIETPDAWHQALAAGLQEGEGDLRTWWTTMEDPLLDSLVARANAGNLDVHQAVANLEEAAALRGIARGEFFPAIGGTSDVALDRQSEDIVSVVPPPRTRSDSFFSLGLDSSWELDVWGRIRRSVESANASLQASLEDYRDTLVILYANVGISYVEVRTLQQRVRYANENIAIQRSTLGLTQDRNRAGLVGDLDVRQAEENLANTEAFLPVLEQSLARAIHRLGVLLGELPGSLYPELAPPGPVPKPPANILVDVPTDLLRQRPDLRSAERALAAQTAQIGVATADLFPRFALLGTFAFEGIRGDDFLSWSNRAFAFGPSVRWNLFEGGRIRANIDAEKARTEQALYFYEQTVLRAYEEVENAMVAYVQETERRDALERSATAAAQAVELVDTLYRTGLTDFQNVLDTQRSLFVRQDELAESEGLVVQNLIRVYKALGGGWDPNTLPAASS